MKARTGANPGLHIRPVKCKYQEHPFFIFGSFREFLTIHLRMGSSISTEYVKSQKKLRLVCQIIKFMCLQNLFSKCPEGIRGLRISFFANGD